MTNVLEYLENSERRIPENIAVEDTGSNLTFAELGAVARGLGTAMAGVSEPGRPIAVYMEKSAAALCALFGAVYAGCFYIFISPDQTDYRAGQILSCAGPDCVVTTREFAGKLAGFYSGRTLIYEEAAACKEDRELLAALRRRSRDVDPVYCNFTSGSTGTPKGVLVCHRSVIDFMEYFPDMFGITEKDVIGNQAPFDFDVSVKDIYSAMKVGARLVIIPRKYFSVVTQLLDYLCEREVTTLIWAVSALCLVAQFRGLTYRVPEKVTKILFSGEVMPIKYLSEWQDSLPSAKFVNLYGPTEITCNCTYHLIDRRYSPDEKIPAGVPFPNEKVFLLDDNDRLVTQPGVPGEICVGGTALALGYYNAPEITAKSFVQNPLNHLYPETIYRTGDMAQYGEDGELYFAGRRDFQIKYMGHRIELEEIDRAMSKIDGVERACCLFDTEKNRLAGFYTGTAEPRDIKTGLHAVLPMYMVPARLTRLDEMPLTPNCKIDRKRLLAAEEKK